MTATRRHALELPILSSGLLWLRTGVRHGLLVVVMLLWATTSLAGRVPEEWDDLPQFNSISFSKTSIGLGERYLFDRVTSRIQEVSKEQFEQVFAGSIGFKAAEVIKCDAGIATTVVLKTSSGNQLTTQNAYCAEGEHSEHALWLDEHPVKDHVDPCASVSCAEIVGDNLWLGTRYDGELGEYPAQGIVVQTLDEGRLVKTLSTKQGLTGNLIRTIRLDPFDETVWISTNEGINVVDQNFRVRKTLFFYLELDPETGNPRLGLSPEKRKSEPLAMMFVALHVSDAKGLYAAVSSIPMAVQERFASELEDGQYSLGQARSLETAFAPKEMNALVPFYLEAARSSDAQARSSALFRICAFNDERVVDFLMESDLPVANGPSRDPIRECLDKFMRFDLLSDQHKTKFDLRSAQQKKEWITLMLQQESDALGKIHAATSTSSAYTECPVVVSAATALKQAGDRRGMDLLNDYFRASDGKGVQDDGNWDANGGNFDAILYQCISLGLFGENEIAPAILEGLEKFKRPSFSRHGCEFFDMRRTSTTRVFDAKYAEAMLVAMERGPRIANRRPQEDTCAEAFKSQLGDADVHRAFFEEVYPQLTPPQKALVDKLSNEPPYKICPLGCEEWCSCQ